MPPWIWHCPPAGTCGRGAAHRRRRKSGTASVYAVVDQTYVNNKISSPQADVVRLIADLKQVNGVWKISDVTVLEGATPASAGSASGSAGSNVPGQEGDGGA